MAEKLRKLTVAVATMGGRAISRGFHGEPYLVVDQSSCPSARPGDLRYIHMRDYGLSKSRNLAIDESHTDYLLFADDDIEHLPNAFASIVEAFEATGADILTMRIQTPDGLPFKSYRANEFQHSLRTLFKTNSIEIAIKTSSIKNSNLRFDERFGLGSTYPTGEEIIFLIDAHRSNLRIHYYPLTIVTHPKESSGGALSGNPQLIQAKGAMFARIFGYIAFPYCFLFALKHYKKSGFSFYNFSSLIFKGCYSFLRILNKEN